MMFVLFILNNALKLNRNCNAILKNINYLPILIIMRAIPFNLNPIKKCVSFMSPLGAHLLALSLTVIQK
jgi:hypothetical protein